MYRVVRISINSIQVEFLFQAAKDWPDNEWIGYTRDFTSSGKWKTVTDEKVDYEDFGRESDGRCAVIQSSFEVREFLFNNKVIQFFLNRLSSYGHDKGKWLAEDCDKQHSFLCRFDSDPDEGECKRGKLATTERFSI